MMLASSWQPLDSISVFISPQQRQRRQVESQFMELLQNANPSVTYKTSWEDVQKLLGNDPAFQAVQRARRKSLFDTFQAAAQKKAEKAQKAAIDALRVSCCLKP